MDQPNLLTKTFATCWGYVGLAALERGLVRIVLPRKKEKDVVREIRNTVRESLDTDTALGSVAQAFEILDVAEGQIREYLAGKRRTFDLPLARPDATAFARAVWRACSEIPYGETRSYQWIARRIRRPKASRAVGTALGANPLPLVVPCHRVICSDGSLGGYGGGLELKRRLLVLERKDSTS